VLVDGDRSSVWRIDPVLEGEARWLQVDLGRPRSVGGVRCVPATGNAPGIFRSRIEVSDDGESWQLLDARFEPSSLEDLVERPLELAYYEARFPPRRLRYLRVLNRGIPSRGEAFEMSELEVLGDCAGEPLSGCPPRTSRATEPTPNRASAGRPDPGSRPRARPSSGASSRLPSNPRP
jgi:hypothetical protein